MARDISPDKLASSRPKAMRGGSVGYYRNEFQFTPNELKLAGPNLSNEFSSSVISSDKCPEAAVFQGLLDLNSHLSLAVGHMP